MAGVDRVGGARTGAHVAHALLVQQLAGGVVCEIAQELAEYVADLALDGLLLHPDARWARLRVQVKPDLRLCTAQHSNISPPLLQRCRSVRIWAAQQHASGLHFLNGAFMCKCGLGEEGTVC